ncbi:hypothetical protein ABZP36_022831 [Zizania latifolia]
MLARNVGPRAVLARCQQLYDEVGSAFAEAHDDINDRDYAVGKEKVAQATSLARQCDCMFAVVPPLIMHHHSYAIKIAVIYTAITNLVK